MRRENVEFKRKDVLKINQLEYLSKDPGKRQLEKVIRALQNIEQLTITKINRVVIKNDETIIVTNLSKKELFEGITNHNNESITTEETKPLNIPSAKQQVEEMQYETPVNASEASSIKPECITFDALLTSPNYDDVYDFIKEVERLERIVRIDKISFSVPNGDVVLNGLKETIQTTLQLTTFYYKDKTY